MKFLVPSLAPLDKYLTTFEYLLNANNLVMNHGALKGVTHVIGGLRSQLDIYMHFFAPKCLMNKETESVTGY
ncbi:hypothetical protein A162_22885 [Vibrio tasmaniensis 1F-155]|nr:hypothetical protein A162_22885 [Vibrio tasmaniensis 1F-155]